MKAYRYKQIFLSIFIGLFIFQVNQQQAQAQQTLKYLSVCNVFDNLIFGRRFNKSIDEINKLLIKQIQEIGVDFKLNAEEEQIFKEIGANDLLVKTIRENFSKIIQEQSNLYKKFTDNYDGKTVTEKKIALEAAKEFLKKYSDDESVKQIIDYLKINIPLMEKEIERHEKTGVR